MLLISFILEYHFPANTELFLGDFKVTVDLADLTGSKEPEPFSRREFAVSSAKEFRLIKRTELNNAKLKICLTLFIKPSVKTSCEIFKNLIRAAPVFINKL